SAVLHGLGLCGDHGGQLEHGPAPLHHLNFLKLGKVKHYNYCLIYNVQRDFIIQTPWELSRGGESIRKLKLANIE
uniref:PPIase cyclophilin-type domain-containing protein n=1 Tax=Junco hyemalis TaxID=40217 RepID=A0A8C5J448_JUNHY